MPMKTSLFLVATVLTTSSFATSGVVESVHSTTAPSVEMEALPSPNQIVYLPRLPSATELTNSAAAHGLIVDRMVQTANQMGVVYRTATGQTNVVSYQLLPAAGVPGTPVMPSVNMPTTPAPTVVYAQAAPTYVYRYGYSNYDPWYWYAPVAIGLGLNFSHYGYHHGGAYYHGGGFRHWRH
jgi:hypothetical protein